MKLTVDNFWAPILSNIVSAAIVSVIAVLLYVLGFPGCIERKGRSPIVVAAPSTVEDTGTDRGQPFVIAQLEIRNSGRCEARITKSSLTAPGLILDTELADQPGDYARYFHDEAKLDNGRTLTFSQIVIPSGATHRLRLRFQTLVSYEKGAFAGVAFTPIEVAPGPDC